PLASSEYVTSMMNGYAPTANNLVLGAPQNMVGTFADNSLNLASGGSLTIAPMQIFTLSSGGVLLQSGNGGILAPTGSTGFLSAGGAALNIFSPGATPATTTISSTLIG